MEIIINMRHELTIVKTITVGCHLRRGDLEERLQKGLRFKFRESQRLVVVAVDLSSLRMVELGWMCRYL